MARIDAIIFGYRKITIPPNKLSLVTSIFIRSDIIATFNLDGTLSIRERDAAKARSLLEGRVEFSESETLGLLGVYKRIKNKKAIFISGIIGCILVMLLSNMVWDIRVEGNERIPDAKIIMQLDECGFSLGDFWSSVDRGTVESHFLDSNDEISWININRRGTVAYVSVIESERNGQPRQEQSGYANIVAEYDCIIEEITVKSGIAVVNPGDVVKKGDLLISGILPPEAGGGLCYADGAVIGRMSETVDVNISRSYEKKMRKSERIYSININFFDFSINIFKLYGNSGKDCDIIEYIKIFSLFGERRLPFSLSIKRLVEYDLICESYTDEQMVTVACDRLNAAVLARLAECDLLKIKTDGKYTDTGYMMSSHIVFLAEIGHTVEFAVE